MEGRARRLLRRRGRGRGLVEVGAAGVRLRRALVVEVEVLRRTVGGEVEEEGRMSWVVMVEERVGRRPVVGGRHVWMVVGGEGELEDLSRLLVGGVVVGLEK